MSTPPLDPPPSAPAPASPDPLAYPGPSLTQGNPARPQSGPPLAQPGPSLAQHYWPGPTTVLPLRLGLASTALAILGAASLQGYRFGVQLGLLSTGIAMIVSQAARLNPTPSHRVGLRQLLAATALGLSWVTAFRDISSTVLLALLGALGCAGLAAISGRRWWALWATGPLLAIASLRGPGWLWRSSRTLPHPTSLGPWLRAAALSLALGLPVAALLAAADPSFGALASDFIPPFSVSGVVIYVFWLIALGAFTLALAFLVANPPAWSAPQSAVVARPTVEWSLPLLVVSVLLTAFLALQTATLFGTYSSALAASGVTEADRARQGFGQLLVVTMVGVALLAWAARRVGASPTQRRPFTFLGGALVALLLGVVASAIRRLWLYEQASGWTVARLQAAAFELWLGAILLLLAAAWLVRRTDLLPRAVALTAGLGLLVLSILSPDALVANWNVERYRNTGRIDTYYLAGLSADAVPALSRLPEPLRTEALLHHGLEASLQQDAWLSWNLARWRAARILH